MAMSRGHPLRSNADVKINSNRWREEYMEPPEDTPQSHVKVFFDGIPTTPLESVVERADGVDAIDITTKIRISDRLYEARIRKDAPVEETTFEQFASLLHHLSQITTHTIAYDDGDTAVIDIRLSSDNLGSPAMFAVISELEHIKKTMIITDRKQVEFSIKFQEAMDCGRE